MHQRRGASFCQYPTNRCSGKLLQAIHLLMSAAKAEQHLVKHPTNALALQEPGLNQHLKVASAGYIGGAVFFSDLDRNHRYSRAMEKALASSWIGDIQIAPTFGPPKLPFVVVQTDVGGLDSLTRRPPPYIRFRAPAGVHLTVWFTDYRLSHGIWSEGSRRSTARSTSSRVSGHEAGSHKLLCRSTHGARKRDQLAHHA